MPCSVHSAPAWVTTSQSIALQKKSRSSRRSLEKRFRDRSSVEQFSKKSSSRRLERAKRLLLETTYPISKVAEIAGFGSAGYFIQFFQKQVGKTPRKYRVELTT